MGFVRSLSNLLQSSANKQSPLDPLPTWFFKKIGVDVAPLLVKIFNRSFTEGYVPIRFKMAVVTPLIKKEGLDVDYFTNFLSISNVSLVSKMLERLVCQRMNTHLQNIGTLQPVKSAYRRFYSTETALTKVMSDNIMAADAGDITLLTLLDLSAAFDRVNHVILLQRLHNQRLKTFPVTV